MTNEARQVGKVKAAILNNQDFLPLLADVLTGLKPSVLRPLLLMMEFDLPDYLHEMWTVTHSAEAFPTDVYVKELVKACNEMERSAPCFLAFLIGRIMRSQDFHRQFERAASEASQKTKKCLIAVLEKIRHDLQEAPEVHQRCDETLAQLTRR